MQPLLPHQRPSGDPRLPDDADLESTDFSSFEVHSCRRCGNVLRSGVVLFAATVARNRVDAAARHLDDADCIGAQLGSLILVASITSRYAGERSAKRRMGYGPLPQPKSDCATVAANLHQAIPAFRIPSGATLSSG